MKITSKAEFEQEVLQDSQPVLVEFFATWCPHCQAQEPLIQEIEQSGRIKVVQVDIDQNPELTEEYEIEGTPTMFLFDNGKIQEKQEGTLDKEDLLDFISVTA